MTLLDLSPPIHIGIPDSSLAVCTGVNASTDTVLPVPGKVTCLKSSDKVGRNRIISSISSMDILYP